MATYYIRTTGNNANAGTSTGAAWLTLRYGLEHITYGDTLDVEAGITYDTELYYLPFYLPGKGTPPTNTSADYITVRSSAHASLPSGRVSPADAANMPRIRATGTGGAFQFGDANGGATEKAAKWWKLDGLEITNVSDGVSNTTFGATLVVWGGYADIQNNWVNRCYIHAQEEGTSEIYRTAGTGIHISSPPTGGNVLNSKITNNYISGFGGFYKHTEPALDAILALAIGTNVYDGLEIDNNYLNAGYQPWFPGSIDPVNPKEGVVQASPTPTLTSCTLDNTTGLDVGMWVSIEQVSLSQGCMAQAKIATKVGNAITFEEDVFHWSGACGGLAGVAPIAGKKIYWDGDVPRNATVTRNTFDVDYDIAYKFSSMSGTAYTGGVASSSTDFITFSGGAPANGTVIFFETDIPGGLSAFPSSYYVVEKSGNDIKVSDTFGGSAINLTSNTTATAIRAQGASGAKGSIEMKGGLDVLIEGNIFQGWQSANAIQSGNQNGDAAWNTVDNLTIRNNWFKSFYALAVLNMGTPAGDGLHHNRVGNNLLIHNNLCTDQSGVSRFLGNIGYVGDNMRITHNTIISNPTYVGEPAANVFVSVSGTNAIIKDNIFQYGAGWGSVSGLPTAFPGFPDAVETNVIRNDAGFVSDAAILAIWENSYVATAGSNPIAFVGSDEDVITDWVIAGGSQYKAGGARDASDGADQGANIAAIITALANLSPIVNAGADQSLGSGTTSTTLTATADDPEDEAMTYLWTRISGPNTPTIVSATSLSTSVTGMIAGTYVFRFQATDTESNIDTDDVQVTIASGGSNVIVRANWGARIQ